MVLCEVCHALIQYDADGPQALVASCGCASRRPLEAGEVIARYVQRDWGAPGALEAANKVARRALPPVRAPP